MPDRLPLILASRSPQRRAILARLGVTFTVRASDAAELDGGDPVAVAAENALRKARAVARPGAREAVLGVDTLVALDGRIYGKPPDAERARATLLALSGATHQVISGLALVLPDQTLTATATTEVSFRTLSEPLLEWYVAGGEWRERAGAYAIQRAGAALVRGVRGDYENVVGLPLAALLDLYPALLCAGRSERP